LLPVLRNTIFAYHAASGPVPGGCDARRAARFNRGTFPGHGVRFDRLRKAESGRPIQDSALGLASLAAERIVDRATRLGRNGSRLLVQATEVIQESPCTRSPAGNHCLNVGRATSADRHRPGFYRDDFFTARPSTTNPRRLPFRYGFQPNETSQRKLDAV
jgi:hypothetical protein